MIFAFVPMLSEIDLQVWLKEQMFVAAGHWIPYEPPFLAALDTFLFVSVKLRTIIVLSFIMLLQVLPLHLASMLQKRTTSTSLDKN